MMKKKCYGPQSKDDAFGCPFHGYLAKGERPPASLSECQYNYGSKDVFCSEYRKMLQERKRRANISKKKSFLQRLGL